MAKSAMDEEQDPRQSSPADERRRMVAELGRRGGKKGGKARVQKLSPERRKEIARKAAATRWAKKLQAVPSTQNESWQATPNCVARGAIELDDKPIECFVLDTGERLVGFRSAASLFCGEKQHDFQEIWQKLMLDEPTAFRQPGMWQMLMGLPVGSFVHFCHQLILHEQGSSRSTIAAKALMGMAIDGLNPLIDAAAKTLNAASAASK